MLGGVVAALEVISHVSGLVPEMGQQLLISGA